jgi:hypothetical protein
MKGNFVLQFLAPVFAAFLLASPPAFADDHDAPSPLKAAILRGADLHLARQGSFANGDTGVGLYDAAWEWQIGTGWAYRNTQGPSARGLVAAFRATGREAYLAGAVSAANQAVGRFEAHPADRPYSEDVLLLTDVSDATGDPGFAARAASYHARTRARFPTGAELADYYLVRKSLAGWDLASQVLAALAVDQEDYARDIALELIARRAEWEHLPYGGYDYTVISQAALLEALADLEGRTVKAYAREIRQLTLQAQAADGSWAEGDYQATAFALQGLLASPKSREVKRAAASAIAYLLATQTPEGGWSFGAWGEYGEVNGEVLSALAAARHRHGDDEKAEDRESSGSKREHGGHEVAKHHDHHDD